MKHNSRESFGNLFAVSSFIIWGFLAFYWKALHMVPALQIVLHRILWCFLFMICMTLLRGRMRELFRVVSSPRNVLTLTLAGILVGANWFIYVLAISIGRVVEAGMGYYINPLMNIFLGLLFFREKLSPLQILSLVSACVGVAILTIGSGVFPWISISLAITFALYGLIKKTVPIPTDLGLTLECMFISPAALILLLVLRSRYGPVLGSLPPLETWLLPATGLITALPLLLFSEAVKRIPLSRMGFYQFIAPTIMFLIGVVVYKEPLTTVKIVSFLFIWAAVILFLLPAGRRKKAGIGN